ncbi:MAG: DUF58 domain-containing protein [Betaproteobacteria bacterium]|nr:DUF58 domain-containing protein [Betaproteobacteria bacterium]
MPASALFAVPAQRLRNRFDRWADARHPPGLATRLGQRNIYILPTRAGLLYAALLLALLVGSINYQLNLGYLLTFMLAGVGVMGMHVTHRNLRGLDIALQPPEPAYAGGSARLRVVLSTDDTPRYGISLRSGQSHLATVVDVVPGDAAVAELAMPVPQRGLQPVARIAIESRFPLGLWRAWSHWRPEGAAAQVLVYPQPEAHAPRLPDAQPAGRGDAAARHRQATQGEFDGVRPYRSGDALKRVVWKKFAKADELVSRDDLAQVRSEVVLDLQQCGVRQTEPALSRLTAWVQACDRAELPFELRLGDHTLACGQGHAHTQTALRALALFPRKGFAT